MEFFFSRYFRRVQGIFSIISVLSILFVSCTPTKKSTEYFITLPRDTTVAGISTDRALLKINQKDVLSVNISSLSKEEDQMFNSAATFGTGSTERNPGYAVDTEGNILVHKLGKVHAEGLTRKELQDKLQKELLPYLKDPIVSVQFLNHKVTVMGFVGNPLVINMPEESLPLLEVLVNSGDIAVTGRYDKIMIIRDKGTEKEIKFVTLEDHSILTSPWYYVQPNDIVYVTPDDKRRIAQERRDKFVAYFSITASAVTLLIVVIDHLPN